MQENFAPQQPWQRQPGSGPAAGSRNLGWLSLPGDLSGDAVAPRSCLDAAQPAADASSFIHLLALSVRLASGSSSSSRQAASGLLD